MIEYIAGELVEKTPTYVVIEGYGIGYLIHVSLTTYSDISGSAKAKLLIHYSVSVDIRSGESKHQLYGFSTAIERQLFRQLINISGISATIAHMILSALKPMEFQSVVLNGDAKTLTMVKGLGPKLAQKIIAELREKFVKSEQFTDMVESPSNSLRQEALSALTALGFDRASAVKVINNIVKTDNPHTVEALIKSALKQL